MNIFVTGGSKGIGKGIVEYFSKNNKNNIFCTYNNTCCSYASKNINPYKCDVNNFDDVKKISDIILSKYNIDVLINNAGITRDKTFLKMQKEDWDIVIDTNLKSIYNFTHCFLDGMIKNKFGRIINISSIIGQNGGFGQSNYSASKAGIIGFTKSLAMEVGKYNITSNAIAPGFISTDMTNYIPENIKNKITDKISTKRFGDINEIVSAIEFIINNNYTNGTILDVNGGYF